MSHPIGTKLLSIAAFAFASGCASEIGEVRFANEPIVTVVNDREPVDEPKGKPFTSNLHRVESFTGSLDNTLAMHGKTRAQDINALGEVPASTWFTPRIGVRDIDPAQIRRGHAPDEGAVAARPWTVVSTKVGGLSPGLQILDANGVRYLLKFDRPELPELDTGADVVIQRLAWTLGYHTPVDEIVHFAREDLVLAPDAEVKDLFGNKRPMLVEDLEAILADRDGPKNGLYRGVTSRFLLGAPLGGYPRRGVRKDDPNDTIAHEHRRSIRAQQVLFGWMGHTDIKLDNTLDMWIEDDDVHYVKHYVVDFGNGLGVWAKGGNFPWSGFKHSVDAKYGLISIFTFGAWTRPWELVPDSDPQLRGVGWFESEAFDPARFATNQFYLPYALMDRYDALWAAKLLMKLEPRHIRAAVEAGQYTDPAAAEYLVETLLARQRKSAKHWLGLVNPIDEFELTRGEGGERLCFADLSVVHGFEAAQGTAYALKSYGYRGSEASRSETANATKSGRVCVDGLSLARGHEGYTVFRIATTRDGKELDPVFVHVARSPANGRPAVIGIWRH